jgi:hypothetical protein
MTEHPRPLALERRSCEDLPAADAAAIDDHVAACAACAAELAELAAAHAAHRALDPPDAFVARLAARRRAVRRRLALRVPLVAALAATAGWLVLGGIARPAAPGADDVAWADEVAWKGNSVAIHRRRGDVTELAADGAIRSGDALRLVVRLGRPTSVAAWFVDATGRVDDLVDAPLSLSAGETPLPGSAVVERPCTDGWVVLATGAAASPRTGAALRARLRGGVPAGTGGIPAGAIAVALRCEG